MPGPRVLLLLSTTSYRAEDFLEAADAVGVDVVVGTDHDPVLSELGSGRGALRLSFTDLEASVGAVLEAAAERPFEAVVAAEDHGVLLAAAAAEALDLPHNPPRAVRAARDKLHFRLRTADAGLPTPDFRPVDPDDDPARIARAVDFPCVVKPRALSAGQGVVRVDRPDDFAGAVRRVAAIVRDADPVRRAVVRGPELLAESYVPGREVAVEALLDQGRLRVLAIFDKPDPLEGPYFEETILVTPSRLGERTRREIVETTKRAVGALGLAHGPVHAELRVNEDGVWPLEVAPRSIGGRCARTLRFGSGLSLEELILRQAAGLGVPTWERERSAAGVMMLPVPGKGVLREVRGLDAAREIEGIEEVEIAIAPGREVIPPPEGNRYLGFLFARTDRPERAERALREAHARLRVEIEPLAAAPAGAPASRG